MTDPPPLRLFLDRSTQGRRFVEAVRRLVPLPQIERLAALPGPWVYRIAQHGLERLRLNCDDA